MSLREKLKEIIFSIAYICIAALALLFYPFIDGHDPEQEADEE